MPAFYGDDTEQQSQAAEHSQIDTLDWESRVRRLVDLQQRRGAFPERLPSERPEGPDGDVCERYLTLLERQIELEDEQISINKKLGSISSLMSSTDLAMLTVRGKAIDVLRAVNERERAIARTNWERVTQRKHVALTEHVHKFRYHREEIAQLQVDRHAVQSHAGRWAFSGDNTRQHEAEIFRIDRRIKYLRMEIAGASKQEVDRYDALDRVLDIDRALKFYDASEDLSRDKRIEELKAARTSLVEQWNLTAEEVGEPPAVSTSRETISAELKRLIGERDASAPA